MDDRWPDWTNLMLGLWMLMIPWIFSGDDLSHSQSLNFWLVGGLIMTSSIVVLLWPRRWPEWINLVAGGWLVVSSSYVFSGDRRIETTSGLAGVAIVYLCLLSLWHFRAARIRTAEQRN